MKPPITPLLLLALLYLVLTSCAPQHLTPQQQALQEAHHLCMDQAAVLSDTPYGSENPFNYLDYEQCMREQFGLSPR